MTQIPAQQVHHYCTIKMVYLIWLSIICEYHPKQNYVKLLEIFFLITKIIKIEPHYRNKEHIETNTMFE